MKARRYIHEDGGLNNDWNGWDQLSAEDAGRSAGKRIDERERRGSGQGWKLYERGTGGDVRQRECGSRELQRERDGGNVDRHVGRAHDQGSRTAPGALEWN